MKYVAQIVVNAVKSVTKEFSLKLPFSEHCLFFLITYGSYICTAHSNLKALVLLFFQTSQYLVVLALVLFHFMDKKTKAMERLGQLYQWSHSHYHRTRPTPQLSPWAHPSELELSSLACYLLICFTFIYQRLYVKKSTGCLASIYSPLLLSNKSPLSLEMAMSHIKWTTFPRLLAKGVVNKT